MTRKKWIVPLGALWLCAGAAVGQDSISNIPAPQAPGDSDALDPFSGGDQCREYVLDLVSITTSWGTEFCVGPLIKSGRMDPAIENINIGAQSISRKVTPGFYAPSYAEWMTPGEGVNVLFNDPPAGSVSPLGSATQLGVAINGSNGIFDTITGAVVTFDQVDPARVYVERRFGAVSSNDFGITPCGDFGLGAVDATGMIAFRADGIGGDPGCVIVGNNGVRVDLRLRDCTIVNGLFSAGGAPATTTSDDPVATIIAAYEIPDTLAVPNLIPTEIGGPSLFGRTFTGGGDSFLYADGASSAGITDAQGSVAFSVEPMLGSPGAIGTIGYIADLGGGVFRAIELADVDFAGTPLTPFTSFAIPTMLTDICDGTVITGITRAGLYGGSATLSGGTGQVGLGVDQLGRGLAAVTVFRTSAADDPANAIAALIDPAGAATWTLVAWNGPAASHFSVAGRGKPVLDGPGGTVIGYLSSTNELTGGVMVGPSMSAPGIDSVGNVWFTCPVEYVASPADPFNAANIRTTLVRAVLDTSGAADCWELEAVLAEQDIIAGANSSTDYRIERIPIAGAGAVSSSAFFSQNVVQDAFAGIDPSPLSTADSRTLGGLVLQCDIIYDADNNGSFDMGGASRDEAYDVVLYVANTQGVGSGGPPLIPGDGNPPPRTPSETPPAAPGPGACAEGCLDAHEVLDPVHLFSGEFFHDAVDLAVPGRGMDFVWARKYKSRQPNDSAQGIGWDFSYNISLQFHPRGFELSNGWGRKTVYEPSSPNTFRAAEYFRELIQNPGSFTLVFPNTGTWEFNGFNGDPFDGKIQAIVDRNGNQMQFIYDPGTGDLTQIIDTLNRPYFINYNVDGFIQSVTDYTGRQVTYDYYNIGDPDGDFGDLKSVTSPAVVGTPTNNDFPAGKTTTYTYSTGFAQPELNHNLLTITDAKGQTSLINEYAPTVNPSDFEFDRIVRQTWGDPGDVFDVVYVPQIPDPLNEFAVVKAIVNDREGHVTELYFDDFERYVLEQQYTGIANPNLPTDDVVNRPGPSLRPSDPLFYETRRRYNQDSLTVEIINPDQSIEVRTYDVYNIDRRGQGNMIEKAHIAGPLGGDQPVIIETYEYDVGFGGCCGTNFVTRKVDGRGNVTTHQYDPNGNRLQTVHPVPTIVEEWEYNPFGQCTAWIHPDNGSGHRDFGESSHLLSSQMLRYFNGSELSCCRLLC
ncbi:MAG: DUF6531 domain-containing protein [Planctomycetota bacterium]